MTKWKTLQSLRRRALRRSTRTAMMTAAMMNRSGLTVGDRCGAQKVEVLPVGTMVKGFYDLSIEVGWAV